MLGAAPAKSHGRYILGMSLLRSRASSHAAFLFVALLGFFTALGAAFFTAAFAFLAMWPSRYAPSPLDSSSSALMPISDLTTSATSSLSLQNSRWLILSKRIDLGTQMQIQPL